MQLNRLEYNGKLIQQRESDGYVNLTQMCKANGKRLDVYLKADKTKEFVEGLEREFNYHQTVVVNQTSDTASVLDVKEGRHGGTWGHPLIALDLAEWISVEFKIWAKSHIFVLMTTGQTSLDIDPLEMTMQLLSENYREINQNNEIDYRFSDVPDYAHYSK